MKAAAAVLAEGIRALTGSQFADASSIPQGKKLLSVLRDSKLSLLNIYRMRRNDPHPR